MSAGAQWVVLGVSMLFGAIAAMSMGMAVYHVALWIRAKVHRRKTRRQRLRW